MQPKNPVTAIGMVIATLAGAVLLLDFVGSGLLPVGAIFQISSLRGLNVLDALQGRSTEAVEVDGVPQFQGCTLNDDGSADCEFED
ncbi:MAG: hypothetical protein AAF528_04145 [Cyanobacteria bacterium P01_C01_bin.121]